MLRWSCLPMLLMLALVGCEQSGIEAGSSEEEPVGTDVTAEVAQELPTDVASETAQVPEEDIGVMPTPDECEEGNGCFGAPCTTAEDCFSGICTHHVGEMVCSETCDADCPQGWSCTLVTGVSDAQYVCTSNFPFLCLPCDDSSDCSDETPNACVPYAEDATSFCGGACDGDNPCPEGFDCMEVDVNGEGSTQQCVASQGLCECTELAISSNLATPCRRENEHGTCTGARVCSQDGLSDCDAPTPAPEICNGIDDDCDGVIDGDLCDDGNPCTTDLCEGEGGCVNQPLDQGECLDGDACTQGDHCEAGVCVGAPVPCDDGNGCTDDACD
ncbi:MAG: hypothetical protein VX938_09670, partial [Myxococcota bacterium]|nr:hypothetical protein [Myxococcota bacterium]